MLTNLRKRPPPSNSHWAYEKRQSLFGALTALKMKGVIIISGINIVMKFCRIISEPGMYKPRIISVAIIDFLLMLIICHPFPCNDSIHAI